MKWDSLLRAIGVLGVVLAYGVFTVYGSSQMGLVIVLMGILSVVAPEAIDAFPFGPSK